MTMNCLNNVRFWLAHYLQSAEQKNANATRFGTGNSANASTSTLPPARGRIHQLFINGVARPGHAYTRSSSATVSSSSARQQPPVHTNGITQNGDSDSDSDGPILYRDDVAPSTSATTAPNADDNEEDVPIGGGLADKVFRRDTLALKRALDELPQEVEIVNTVPLGRQL